MKKIFILLVLFSGSFLNLIQPYHPAQAVTQPSADNVLYKPAGSGSVNESVKAKLDQIVNVKDKGALCDGTNDDSTAFTNAMASSHDVTVPAGTCIASITIPSNTHIHGSGIGTIIKPTPSFSASAFWQTDPGATNVEIDHLQFDVSKTTYYNTVVLYVNAGQYINIHDVNIPNGGIYAIYAVDAIDLTINNVQAANSAGRPIFIWGTTNATSVRNKVTNSYVSNAGGSDHCISFIHGSALEVSSTYVENCTMFGISYDDVVGGVIQKNTTYNTLKEGINLDDTSNVNVSLNTLSWSGTTDTDFGLSIFGNTAHTHDNNVAINTIVNAGKAGIGIAGGATYGSHHNTITGNIIVNPNRLNLTSANAGDGITLYGSATTKNIVSNNQISDSTPYIHYGISEININGTPSYNKILNNQIDGVVTADYSTVSTTVLDKFYTGFNSAGSSSKSIMVDNGASTAALDLGSLSLSTDADIHFYTSGHGVNSPDVEFYASGGSATADTGAFYYYAASFYFVNGFNASNPTLLCSVSPTIASGFGSGASVSGNTCAFDLYVGTGGTTSSGVLTMPATINAWACDATPVGAPQAAAMTYVASTSTTSVTVTNYTLTTAAALNWTSGLHFNVKCIGR